MEQLKYRRRLDAGLTRVWVGKRRRRILRELAKAQHPVTVTELASRAATGYGLTNDMLSHLEAAGWVNVQQGLVENTGRGDEWARYFWLTEHGDVQVAVLLAPRV